MAINFLNSIDFNQNELLHPRIENQANDTAAGTSVDGQLYFNTTSNILKVSDGLGGWKEVGGGVETLTAAQGTFISFTAATSATGDVDLGTFDLSAAGTPDATKYLRGDNSWEPITGIYAWDIAGDSGTETVVNGDTITFAGGTNVTTSYDTGTNTLTINSTDQYVGTVTSVGLSMPSAFIVTNSPVTSSGTLNVAGAGTTAQYIRGDGTLATFPTNDNYQYWVLSDGTTTTNITSTATATFQGTANEVEVGESSGTITIGLPNDVTIGNNLTVTNILDMTNGQINNLANGTASSDAVNLGQLQSAVAGVGLFKGGYNASTNSPAIAGSSNIALDQGDFYVVTTDGTITFSDTTVDVEVGDLIFANGSISANSNPASTAYTIVIQDQNIAGEGATDGATEKGVAGFNSAHFSVTANGWVSAEVATASTIGIGNVNAATAADLDGLSVTYSSGTATVGLDVNSLPGFTAPDAPATNDTIALYDVSSSTNRKISLSQVAAAIDISKGIRVSLSSTVSGVGRTEAGGLTTFDVNTSTLLGASTALDVKAEIITSGGQTVYADITRSGSTLNVIFTGSVANGTYEALLVDVG